MGGQLSHDVPGWDDVEVGERLNIHFCQYAGCLRIRGEVFRLANCQKPPAKLPPMHPTAGGVQANNSNPLQKDPLTLTQILKRSKIKVSKLKMIFLDGYISLLLLHEPSLLEDIMDEVLETCPKLETFALKLPKALPTLGRFRRILRTTVFPFLLVPDESRKKSKRTKTPTVPKMQLAPVQMRLEEERLTISDTLCTSSAASASRRSTKKQRRLMFVYHDIFSGPPDPDGVAMERCWNSLVQEALAYFAPTTQIVHSSSDCEPNTFQAICSLPSLESLRFTDHILNDFEVITLQQALQPHSTNTSNQTKKRKRRSTIAAAHPDSRAAVLGSLNACLKSLDVVNMAMRHANFVTLCQAIETNQHLVAFNIHKTSFFHTQEEINNDLAAAIAARSSTVDPLLQLLQRNSHLKQLGCLQQSTPMIMQMTHALGEEGTLTTFRPALVSFGGHGTNNDGDSDDDDEEDIAGQQVLYNPHNVDALHHLREANEEQAEGAAANNSNNNNRNNDNSNNNVARQLLAAETTRRQNLDRLYEILKNDNSTITELKIGELQDSKVSNMMLHRYPFPAKIRARLDLNGLGLTHMMDVGHEGCSTQGLGAALIRAKQTARPDDVEQDEFLGRGPRLLPNLFCLFSAHPTLVDLIPPRDDIASAGDDEYADLENVD